MKRQFKTYKGSISSLFVDKEPKLFAKQTVKGLFRVLIESVMEQKEHSIVLFKTSKIKDFSGVLSRLEHSVNTEVFSYCDSFPFSFETIFIDNKNIEKDEFLIILSDRFSVCFFFKEIQENIVEFYSSLNGEETFSIVEYLQSLNNSKKLDDLLKNIRQDRRDNNNLNNIFSRLIELNDEIEKELLCCEVKTVGHKDNEINFSTIAHELRNPLSIIDLNTTLIKKYIDKSNADEETKEKTDGFYQAVHKALELLNSIANSLSDFAKGCKVNLKEENLEELINSSIQLLSTKSEEKNLNINFKNDSQLQTIKLDKDIFSRALLNLLKNAIEASKENEEIFVEILRIKDYILIKIKDNGDGIKEENQNKLFTPFFTTKKTGTGIGLFESQKIIRAHNGDLKLISSDETGTTFGIFLPIIR